MKNALIMHTGGWIGDMVLLTPALRALKGKFPNCRMTMLLLPLVSELMGRNPYLDEVLVYNKHGGQKMMSIVRQIRARLFDTAIILHPNSVSSALIAYISHIPKRVGLRLAGNGLFLNVGVERKSNIHEVHRYLDIVVPIVGRDFSDELEFWGIEEGDMSFADDVIESRFGRKNPIIGINVSTTWKTKQWRMDRFAHLARALHDEMGGVMILTGGKSDAKLGEEIMNIATGSDKYILDLTGRTTLWQLGAIIKNCDVYVTCDSGPMHISAALGTPTVALFGPTDPARHRPFGEGHVAIRKWDDCYPCYKRECKKGATCIDSIQVEDVMRAIRPKFSA